MSVTLTNAALADRYAAAKAALDEAQKLVDALKQDIKNAGKQRLEGDFFAVESTLAERSTLDTKAVKKFLTDEQIALCTKVTIVETLRIKPMDVVGK